jgi:hypothetical protein
MSYEKLRKDRTSIITKKTAERYKHRLNQEKTERMGQTEGGRQPSTMAAIKNSVFDF